ncbi:MAG: hypothetical protein HYS27_25330 [Deltaproteobacteria bacterium]|nr:hypothetical protein [Deltaproteobacteria bacterium]
MQINKKNRRSGTATERASKRQDGEATRTAKTATKSNARAADKVSRPSRHDQVERRLREELEGTGAQGRVRDLVGRLLGTERTPALEQLIARVQAAAKSETASPYGA